MRATRSLALALISVGPLNGGALAQPISQETKKFNEPVTAARCERGDPSALGYPFSVRAIRAALGDQMPETVKVLIVDNSFKVYRINEVVDEDQPVRVASRNFPADFFRRGGGSGEMTPWLDPENADAIGPDENDGLLAHGTLVTGIVLGGMYDNGAAPNDPSNLRSPNARTLLLMEPDAPAVGQTDKPWLKISFLSVRYGAGDAADDPVLKLNSKRELLQEQKIINMSLGRTLTRTESETNLDLGSAKGGPLVVTAAGNSGRELSRNSLKASPATLDDERILVVASHDADGRLSDFSNFGSYVTIAAPGCAISSWRDGENPAVALSGTSMATAVVTFAAALVASRWETDVRGPAYRNRLLASASYREDLLKCGALTPEERSDETIYCVKDGAMLDIPVAVSVFRDFVEFRSCSGGETPNCRSKRLMGDLLTVPDALSACINRDKSRDLSYRGLTLNSGVRRVGTDQFDVLYERGGKLVGDLPLGKKSCGASGSLQIEFRPSGRQPDGSLVDSAAPVLINLSELEKLVTKAIR